MTIVNDDLLVSVVLSESVYRKIFVRHYVDEKFFRQSKGYVYHFSRGCLYVFFITIPQTEHDCWEYFYPVFIFVASVR